MNDLQKLSMSTGLPDVTLPAAAVEISKSVANVALEKISAVPDRAPVSAIPSAAVDLSKSLASVVAVGTNAATETGTRAISSLFGRLGGVISMSGTISTLAVEESDSSNVKPPSEGGAEIKVDDNSEINEVTFDPVKVDPTSKLMVDNFYETCSQPQLAQEMAAGRPFDDFSSASVLSIDLDTLNLLSRHYRNSIEFDEKDELEWTLLQDILLSIISEEATTGISLALSELMYRNNEFVTIEEPQEVNEMNAFNDKLDESVANEEDGWEDDWSDPELSDNSGDDTGDQKESVVSRTVNVAEKFLEDILNYNSKSKSIGADLALYIASLAVLIEDVGIKPDVAFKISMKSVFPIASTYAKAQSEKCDSDKSDKFATKLFLKTVAMVKSNISDE